MITMAEIDGAEKLEQAIERGAVDFLVMPWMPPFKFEVTSVFDSKGNRVCDLRGWGFLTGKGGGLGLDEDTAAKIQDQMGEHIAALLNLNIDALVNKFLCWKLPADFSPDCGISFDGREDDEWNKNKPWPVGTNLLTADQARQMFVYLFS